MGQLNTLTIFSRKRCALVPKNIDKIRENPNQTARNPTIFHGRWCGFSAILSSARGKKTPPIAHQMKLNGGKNMKKLLCTFLAALMLMGMLAGCSGDSTTAKTDMPYAFSAIPYTPSKLVRPAMCTSCRHRAGQLSVSTVLCVVSVVSTAGAAMWKKPIMSLRTGIFHSPSVWDCEGEAMEHREKFTKESFWKEALKADSLLLWIAQSRRFFIFRVLIGRGLV